MYIRLSIMLASAVLMAGCEAAETNNAAAIATEAASQPAGYTQTQQKVVDLPDRLRHGVLFRAILDGGAPCQGIVKDIRQPDRAGAPLYVAQCKDGPQYAVAIAPSGMAEVTRLDRGKPEQSR